MKKLEERIIKAIAKQSNTADKSKHLINIRLAGNPYFYNNYNVFNIFFFRTSLHFPVFRVATDKNLNIYVFYAYEYFLHEDKNYNAFNFLHNDCNNFSKIIKKEQIIVTSSNIEDYIKRFLFFVRLTSRTTIISDYKELICIPDEKKELFEKYKTIIHAPYYEHYYEHNVKKIKIKFYTKKYDHCLRKWQVIIYENGEILSCNIEDLEPLLDYLPCVVAEEMGRKSEKSNEFCNDTIPFFEGSIPPFEGSVPPYEWTISPAPETNLE